MCTVLLQVGGYQIAVNKSIISYIIYHIKEEYRLRVFQNKATKKKHLGLTTAKKHKAV
jgi:hypothetical protein